MNHVRLIFEYADLAAYEREEARDSADSDYALVARAMPFVDSTLEYAIYRTLE